MSTTLGYEKQSFLFFNLKIISQEKNQNCYIDLSLSCKYISQPNATEMAQSWLLSHFINQHGIHRWEHCFCCRRPKYSGLVETRSLREQRSSPQSPRHVCIWVKLTYMTFFPRIFPSFFCLFPVWFVSVRSCSCMRSEWKNTWLIAGCSIWHNKSAV